MFEARTVEYCQKEDLILINIALKRGRATVNVTFTYKLHPYEYSNGVRRKECCEKNDKFALSASIPNRELLGKSYIVLR